MTTQLNRETVSPVLDVTIPKSLIPRHSKLHSAGYRFREAIDISRSSNLPHYLIPAVEGVKLLYPSVTSSSVDDFYTCPRKFMLRYRFGLVPNRYASAQETGTLFHTIVSELAHGKSVEEAEARATSDNAKTMEELMKTTDPGGFLPGGDHITDVLRDSDESLAMARVMASVVWSSSPIDWERYEILAVELPITLRAKFPHLCTLLRHRLDLVLRDRKTGDGFVWDYKTTSESPVERAETCPFESQTFQYRIAAQAAFPTVPFKGMIHLIVQKPGIRFRPFGKDKLTTTSDYTDAIQTRILEGKELTTAQKEAKHKVDLAVQADEKYRTPYEKYLGRVETWYQEQFSADKTHPPVLQSWSYYADDLYPLEYMTKLCEVTRASRSKISLSNFFRNPQACRSKFGSCPYLPICTAAVSSWSDIIRSRYQITDRDTEAYNDGAMNVGRTPYTEKSKEEEEKIGERHVSSIV